MEGFKDSDNYMQLLIIPIVEPNIYIYIRIYRTLVYAITYEFLEQTSYLEQFRLFRIQSHMNPLESKQDSDKTSNKKCVCISKEQNFNVPVLCNVFLCCHGLGTISWIKPVDLRPQRCKSHLSASSDAKVT